MHRPVVSTKTTQRIDRLLRSLVGVGDVRMLWRAQSLRAIHILRDAGTQPHQLVRNIVSGMHAAFGITVLPTQIHIHEEAGVFEAIEVAADVLSDDEVMEPADEVPAPKSASRPDGNGVARAKANERQKAGGNGVANGARSGGAHGNGGVPVKGSADAVIARLPREPVAGKGETVVVRPSMAPADVVAAAVDLIARRPAEDANAGLVLERIDVERRTGTLRCRTVLALGDRRYSAIAEVPDSPSAEAELAARVAVDALRAGGLTTAMLDGVGFITIGKTNYCVATVREAGNPHPRASAAPLTDSMAAAATAAVLTALGNFTDARAQSRARAGH